MINIINCIRQHKQLSKEDLPELKRIIDKYPYFQVPRLLYLYLLHQSGDSSYNETLSGSSIFITDRRALFSLIQNNSFEKSTSFEDDFHSQKEKSFATSEDPETGKQISEQSNSRSFSLIDDFLSEYSDNSAEEMTVLQSTLPAQEPVSDYTSYLLKMGNQDTTTENSKADEDIPKTTSIATRPIPKKESEEMEAEPIATEQNEGISDKYFTETLAKIYVKQGKYSKALEIIQRLYLRDPNKNIYFADQIRYLEKLLINSRNQKNK